MATKTFAIPLELKITFDGCGDPEYKLPEYLPLSYIRAICIELNSLDDYYDSFSELLAEGVGGAVELKYKFSDAISNIDSESNNE